MSDTNKELEETMAELDIINRKIFVLESKARSIRIKSALIALANRQRTGPVSLQLKGFDAQLQAEMKRMYQFNDALDYLLDQIEEAVGKD